MREARIVGENAAKPGDHLTADAKVKSTPGSSPRVDIFPAGATTEKSPDGVYYQASEQAD